MEENRPNPDEILAGLRQEEDAQKKGKLKIFFGMSPGVGKTYTMLQTAKVDLSRGVHVVAGYIETHNRPETQALLEDIPVIPRKKIAYKGLVLEEMDLDAIIQMHPYLVLVDELAHTNAPGSRHLKRYQDVQELLSNGINVYTTVNVQHLASRADTVKQITGINVRETLPDEIFEQADEVELVDITPNELLSRLAEGKVYVSERSKEAINNFFRKGNITALREMSLRTVADRVDRQVKNYMQQNRIRGPWKSGVHLMVLIGTSPSSAQLIRYTKNIATTMGADWIALHVESSRTLTKEETASLSDNVNLVRQLDGRMETALGEDVVDVCMRIAYRENITHIIVGKPAASNSLLHRKNIVQRLLKKTKNIDVYILGSELTSNYKKENRFSFPRFSSKISSYLLSAAVVAVVTALCIPLAREVGYQSVSFIMLFVLSVLATFLRIGPILLAATLSALAWNFFFISPSFTLHVSTPSDVLALLMFFTIALLNGILTSKTRKQEQLAVNREKQTNALFYLTKSLSRAGGIRDIANKSAEEIKKYFGVEAYFILQDSGNQLRNKKYLPDGKSFSESELAIAAWTWKHSKPAGRFTDTLPSGEHTYYPLKGSTAKPGVVALKQDRAFSGETAIFWDTFLTQISQALEHQFLEHLAHKANLLDESDKLYKTLFNSISHELRIPVSTIMGASDTLLNTQYPEKVKIELYDEIFHASKRLNRLIENLLNMSRLESGRISAHLDWCDVHDLFNRVAASLDEELQPFHVDIVIPESMPLVKLDFGLMEQALYNLVYNSCSHAPQGSNIRLKAFYDNGNLVLQEMDRGRGFPDDSIPYLFNKFYRTKDSPPGGLGLGLSIVKGFIEAHKGTISAENRQHGGARFTIQIPTAISYGNKNE